MLNVGRLIIGLFVLILFCMGLPCFGADYVDCVRESVDQIELGAYDKAANAADLALSINGNDPLAHEALGVIYLHTSHYTDAENEFKLAQESDPVDGRLMYALGLNAYALKRYQVADKYFSAAVKSPESGKECRALLAYLKGISSNQEPSAGLAPDASPLMQESYAVWAFKSGRYKPASEILSNLLKQPAPLGFEEFRAPLASFNTTNPIEFPNAPLKWKRIIPKDANPVSGTVLLRADVNKTPSVSIVTFSVDGDVVGMTNCQPFEFQWNTENHSNGMHVVKIEAQDDAGSVISRKTIKVLLKNKHAQAGNMLSGADAEELRDRLWRCIHVTETRKLAHYYLGRMFLQSGDREAAMKQFVYSIAYDHNFRDARNLLSQARGRRFEYTEIHRGKQGKKRIALTFDDGPNERTADMLAVLDKLHIPVTFFVVGFRAEAQPELIRAMMSGGHEIENHTYTHPRLPTLSIEQAESELAKGAAVVLAMTGKQSMYFRPPGGRSDDGTKIAAARLGLTSIFWTIECSSYEGAKYEQLADHVIKGASDGAIVLMHNGEPATTSALPRIVNQLKAEGYEFVTLSEILSDKESIHRNIE